MDRECDPSLEASPEDIETVELVLKRITGTDQYNKRISGYGVENSLIDLGELSRCQCELLLSPRYLNLVTATVREVADLEPNQHLYATSVPYLFACCIEVPEQPGNLCWQLVLLDSYGQSDDETIHCQPVIKEIREDVGRRRESVLRRRERLLTLADAVDAKVAEISQYGFKIPENPAIKGILYLEIFLAIARRERIDASFVSSLKHKIQELCTQEDESLQSKKSSIGLEIETPMTNPWDGKVPSAAAACIFFQEYDILFQRLGIPTEPDNQGEVALPCSYAVEVQVDLLQLLFRIGFIDASLIRAGFIFPLHANIAIDPDVRPDWDDLAFFGQTMNAVGSCLGIVYAPTERILNGEYDYAVGIKGSHEENTYRIEIRPLCCSTSLDEMRQQLSEIREIVRGALLGFSTTNTPSKNAACQQALDGFIQGINGVIESLPQTDFDLKQAIDKGLAHGLAALLPAKARLTELTVTFRHAIQVAHDRHAA